VSCKSCNSTNQSRFPAEIVIHFPGMKDLNRSQEFAIDEEEIGKTDGCRIRQRRQSIIRYPVRLVLATESSINSW
jgi:hypothetical protein